MSDFQKVANISEFSEENHKSFVVNNVVIVVCKVDQEFYAFRDECSHQTLPLSDGYFDGEVITCCYHGAEFNVKTGEALCLPAIEPIEIFEVKVENDEIFVKVD